MEQIHANKVRDLARRFEEWEKEQQKAAQNVPVTGAIDPNKTYSSRRKKCQQNDDLAQPSDHDSGEEEDDFDQLEARDTDEFQEDENEPASGSGEEEEESVPDEADEANEPEEDADESEYEASGEEGAEEEADDILAKQVDREEPKEDPLSQYRLTQELIEEGSRDLNVPVEFLQRLGRGIKGYAFVRENSGMLKPITIFFHPNSEKLLIIRQKEAGRVNVLYVKVNTLKQMDHSPEALDYLVKNSGDDLLIKTVDDVKTMPHCVLWTNAQFEKTAAGAREMGRFDSIKRRIFGKTVNNVPKRSIVFVLENPADIDAILRLVDATAKRSGFEELNIKPPLS